MAGKRKTKKPVEQEALTQKGFMMGFRINTNIAAMNSHRNATQTNLALDKSLQALSSGIRINTAADDASGMAIANSLKSQSSGLGQAINNANDGIGVTQTADGALDEYQNIINTVRTKAIQAASDGQNTDSRAAIQRDISKLLEEAQNIAVTTQFNGQALLDGSFQNKAFHIGAYKDETVDISISSAQTNAIGAHSRETGATSSGAGTVNSGATAALNGAATSAAVAFDSTVAINSTLVGVSAAGAEAGQTAGSAWAKASAINAVTDKTGVTATAITVATGTSAITAGTYDTNDTGAASLLINGVDIGNVTIQANDQDGSLRNAINDKSDQTGVIATLDGGKLVLTANDGRDIKLDNTGGTTSDAIMHLGDNSADLIYSGKLTVTSESEINIQEGAAGSTGFSELGKDRDISIGNAANTADVTTRENAEDTILTMDYALQQLDSIRSNIGSTQNQLESTIRNISVTQVNVSAAESQIRDVDFADESANFAKSNILAQSGSYAMSQANAVQQNVMRLLQ